MAAVCVGALMSQLDASIVTVALPSLEGAFHASVGAVTWVGLSYLVVLVGTVTAVGRFADMRGRSCSMSTASCLFVLASVLCGLAPQPGHAPAGSGPSRRSGRPCCRPTVWPSSSWSSRPDPSVGLSASKVPPRPSGWRSVRRSGVCWWRRVGGGSSSSSTSPSASSAQWRRSCSSPVSRRAAADGCPSTGPGWSHLLPRRRAPAGGHFLRGGRRVELPVDRRTAVGRCGVGRLVHPSRAGRRDPMMDLSLFAERRFSFGILSGVGSYLVMFGVLLLIPFYVERGLGGGVARSGLELMALPLMFGLVAPLAGEIDRPLRSRPLTVSGMSVVSLGLVVLALVRPGTAGDGWPLGLDRRRSGPLHFAEQCRHHGIRAPTTSRHGFGHLEHEPRHGDRIGAGRDRADLFGERWGCGGMGAADHRSSILMALPRRIL